MPIRSSVFGSLRERRLFKALTSRWGTDYHVYPQLKFHSLMDLEGVSLTPEEARFLLTTEVDFTLCDSEDRPLVSIEFDGLTGGVSRNGSFVPRRPGSSAVRARKFDLKLRVAEAEGYPFVIVSAEEAVPLPGADAPMVLDGIIGQVLAQQKASREIAELGKTLSDEVEGLSEEECDDYIQDRVLDIELMAEYEHDPFVRLASELRNELRETGCYKDGSGMRWLDDESVPPFPDGPFQFTRESYAAFLDSRAKAMQVAPRHGAEVTVTTTLGPISATAWIRNFGLSSGCLSLVEHIAEVRALRKALRTIQRSKGPTGAVEGFKS